MHVALLAAVFLTPSNSAVQSAPRMLVVQYMVPKDGDQDLNVPIRAYFHRELHEDGRVIPIAYAMSDAGFRALVEANTVLAPVDSPSDDQLFTAAQQGKFEYIFYVQALRHLDTIYISAKLMKNRREIWSDRAEVKSSAVSGFSIENAASSTARTWVMKLAEGPLKQHQRNAVGTKPPELDPIQAPTQPAPDPTPTPAQRKPIDNVSLRAELDRLIQLGEKKSAIDAARRAVDEEPLDLQRRLWLIELLQSAKLGDQALAEARRAAFLFPDAPELRLWVADSHIATGEFEEAASALLEIMVRDPKNAAIRIRLAQVYLFLGKQEAAQEHLKEVDPALPSAIVVQSAMAAIRGDSQSSGMLWKSFAEQYPSLSTEEQVRARAFCARFAIHGAEQLGATTRELIQWVRRDAKSKDAVAAVQKARRQVVSLTGWIEAIDASMANPQLRETVLLGCRLLTQALSEAELHTQQPTGGSADDATITLGEAMRMIGASRKML